MTKEELISALKPYGFPQTMLTRNLRSQIGAAISGKTKGNYNHFCWLISENSVASQDMTFKEVPLDEYLGGKHIVKFVTDTRWTVETKIALLRRMRDDLNKPWYKRLYDPLAILGQYTGLKWLQMPWMDICSDDIKYLRGIDPDYDLEYPNPTDVNQYQKDHQATPRNGMKGYLVTARWLPEDL